MATATWLVLCSVVTLVAAWGGNNQVDFGNGDFGNGGGFGNGDDNKDILIPIGGGGQQCDTSQLGVVLALDNAWKTQAGFARFVFAARFKFAKDLLISVVEKLKIANKRVKMAYLDPKGNVVVQPYVQYELSDIAAYNSDVNGLSEIAKKLDADKATIFTAKNNIVVFATDATCGDSEKKLLKSLSTYGKGRSLYGLEGKGRAVEAVELYLPQVVARNRGEHNFGTCSKYATVSDDKGKAGDIKFDICRKYGDNDPFGFNRGLSLN